MLYEVNHNIRDYFTYTEAMLNNSLFSSYLKKNGMKVYTNKNNKHEYTRDIVCLDFDFGSKSYEEEINRLQKLLENADSEQSREKIQKVIQRVHTNKDSYVKKTRGEIRTDFYENGVDITYDTKDRSGATKSKTIHYKMLFRTSAKAKIGQVIFINSKLYKKAYDWLTMGLGKRLPKENAKIVELSAYAPLTTSTIVGTLNVPVQDVFIIKDQESEFKTFANIVTAETYVDSNGQEKKKCVVNKEYTTVKNTLWDGMGIIESGILPDYVNGMALLRNHFFKMCGIRGHIQLFFKDWCNKNGYDYETHQIEDMFGNLHYVKDIKIITTHNAIKWIKFSDLMGGTLQDAYKYWCDRISLDGDTWGIVKTDHPSKLGDYQQLSYQMVNTLPCTKDDVCDIAQHNIDYIKCLKEDNDEFERFLRKNVNEINHYEMLADLYANNNDFANSQWFKVEKKKIISSYVNHLRKGKIHVSGDNLTVFGNPYGLLLYSVGEDWKNDLTLQKETDCIQCYTPRFEDGEYLAAFRNPHNSPNNICYMHNTYSEELNKYFEFSENIVAINCIGTDIQDRANGMDEDSDFMLFTNNPTIVQCAKKCYAEYPTIVNRLRESGITYRNTMRDYADMDNKFAGTQIGIGWSSNLAQLAMTYYWTEKAKIYPDEKKLQELYDNFIILSVIAQIVIDSCKREYEIDGETEMKRISKSSCMVIKRQATNGKYFKYDFPLFMMYTREVEYTKDGVELPEQVVLQSKRKLHRRINHTLVCPMNWLEDCFDKIPRAIQSNGVDTLEYVYKLDGYQNYRQQIKILEIIESYDNFVKHIQADNKDNQTTVNLAFEKFEKTISELKKIKTNNANTINWLILIALGMRRNVGDDVVLQVKSRKLARKILNCLYKMNKEKFLKNFKKCRNFTL
jgi:hypothetical protein